MADDKKIDDFQVKKIATFDKIQLGFATISYNHLEITQAAYAAAARFFACPLEYKKQFSSHGASNPGYHCLSNREFFTLRDLNVPKELIPCLDYIRMIYPIACSCLQTIAEKIALPPEKLLNLITENPFPETEISPSLLRVFSYLPNAQNGRDEDFSSDPHQDLSLVTLMPLSAYPALEVFDYSAEGEWLPSEAKLNINEMLVLVGEVLNKITHGYLLSATHRVQKINKPRISLVYHLNPKPEAILNSDFFETSVMGPSPEPFSLTAEEFLLYEMKNFKSVNEED